ncbi:hypothetical protein [Spiroplasma endosymbiont of Othius punctulatus]|uniref:hypothetical protein n=1 Tax=Spiroplasma endosymbiont of Othius punctulatus TaxID=3066289 RepID=UPI0030D4DACF
MVFEKEMIVIFAAIILAVSIIILLSTVFYLVKVIRIDAKVKHINYPVIGTVITLMMVTLIIASCSLALKESDAAISLLISSFVMALISFVVVFVMFNQIALVITPQEVYIFSDKINIDQIEAVIVDKDRKRLFIAFKNHRKQLKSTSFVIGRKYEKMIVENVDLLGKEVQEINFENWKKSAQRVDKI